MINKICIAFICGCLEESKDGVGDYTLIMAKQLALLGHIPICIAINDRYISCPPNSFPSVSSVGNIMVVRFGCKSSWLAKSLYIQKLIKKYNVSILSLQYVPYAFSSKGVPFGLLAWLPFIRNKTRWHIMCHELWVDGSLKTSNVILAFFQKSVLIALLKLLNPVIIHTTNHYYQNSLHACGFINSVLPLYSNISMVKTFPKLVKIPNRWVFIFFGSIHHEWNSDYFFSRLQNACINNNITDCQLLLIGRSGQYGANLWSKLIHEYSRLSFRNLGECSQDEISLQLQFADFGVTTTPSHLIEKSGTVAAMLSHGLPVIITRVTTNDLEWNRKLKSLPEFVLFDPDFEKNLLSIAKYPPRQYSNSTAVEFLQAIQQSFQ